MHVLILPSWYFPADSHEITGRMFHQLARAVRKEEIDARIFYAEFNLQSGFFKKSHHSIEGEVPTWRVNKWFPPKINSWLTHAWITLYADAIKDYIRKEGKPDIIHAQSYLAGSVAAALKKITGIPFIITERLSDFITGRVPKRYVHLIKDAFHEADCLTCVSPGLQEYLQQYTSSTMEVIPNFFDPDVFYHDPTTSKNEFFTWVTIGEHAHIKGLDILLQAYSEFRKKMPAQKMKLIMIDEVQEKQDLMESIQRYGVSEEIVWTGLITQKEIAEILRRSHVFVSASRFESFGKAIVEAQACGLPVIATRTDGANFIMSSPAQGILIRINDVEEMTGAMEHVYNDYHRYDSEKIVQSVDSRFSEKVVTKKWKEVYNRIAS